MLSILVEIVALIFRFNFYFRNVEKKTQPVCELAVLPGKMISVNYQMQAPKLYAAPELTLHIMKMVNGLKQVTRTFYILGRN